MIRPLAKLYRHLNKTYPLFEGCAPCPYRPLPHAERRAAAPAPLFPVDFIYTWVDGNDPILAKKREEWLPDEEQRTELAQGSSLYANNEELRFSLRSLELYAPWARKIFIVTDAQVPAWLRTAHKKIHIVDHRDCIPSEYLPTFNSHVIEPYLHCIPGLADHYIYMNDDFFLASPCRPEDFFTPNGLPYLFMDWRYSRRHGYAKAATPHACSHANTRAYIEQKGITIDQDVIVGHIPYAQTRNNAAETLAFFKKPITAFSTHKFRAYDEMAFYCHCLPYWTYAHKKAVPFDLPFYYINTARFDRKVYYTSMLKEKNSGVLPLFFCLNDVGTPRVGDTRHSDMRDFLTAFYPEPSSFER